MLRTDPNLPHGPPRDGSYPGPSLEPFNKTWALGSGLAAFALTNFSFTDCGLAYFVADEPVGVFKDGCVRGCQQDFNVSVDPTAKITALQPSLSCGDREVSHASARVHSSAAPLSTAGEVPIGLNLDWWGANATNNEGTTGLWDDSSLLVLDLDNPRLKAVVKAFGSSLIRMGGTLGDEIGYDVGEKPVRNCPTQHAPGVNVSYCLSMGRWDELHAWCAELGCRIAFGLNALYGREGNPRHNIPNVTGSWDSENTLALLKYTASKGYGRHNTLFGFELGNELQGSS